MVVVFRARDVVLAQAQVDQLEGLVGRVDQHVVGLDIAVHDPLRVEVVEGLGQEGGTLKSWVM